MQATWTLDQSQTTKSAPDSESFWIDAETLEKQWIEQSTSNGTQ